MLRSICNCCAQTCKPSGLQAAVQVGNLKPYGVITRGWPSRYASLVQGHYRRQFCTIASSTAGQPPALSRRITLPRFSRLRSYPSTLLPRLKHVQVDVTLEAISEEEQSTIAAFLETFVQDARRVARLAVNRKAEQNKNYKIPERVILSLVICDNSHIQELNMRHRGKNKPTDVLSFEMEDAMDYMTHLPMKLLGDVVISLEMAQEQAREHNYELLDELRVLLVHGVLHLCGYDHERGPEEEEAMSGEEQRIMAAMGWQGQGLIDLSEDEGEEEEAGPADLRGAQERSAGGVIDVSVASTSSSVVSGKTYGRAFTTSDVRLVAIDMDGTLLDSRQRISAANAEAIREAAAAGVRVVLATGKARPAAIRACTAVGLEGRNLLVSSGGPGVFLQGLAVHGLTGQQLMSTSLPSSVVAAAFRYSQQTGVSCVAFLGDTCLTLKLTPQLRELHDRYYEPLAVVVDSVGSILAGLPVKKLLFMTNPAEVTRELIPYWRDALRQEEAQVVQAVPDMLEIVPAGVNKWLGLQTLLSHMDVDPQAMMAIGDGMNDYEMISKAGLGVAMANAVPKVKEVASVVVSSNDADGVAEALRRYVL